MELSEYAIEELKAELKRRSEAKKQEKEAINRCRNCRFIFFQDDLELFPLCSKQPLLIKKYNRKTFKRVSKYAKACNKYERKES